MPEAIKTFHQLIVDRLEIADLPKLKGQCFVFPTKRGGLFFQRALLQRHGQQNFMLPTIFSIEEFVQHMTGRHMTDELTLLFELYEMYRARDKDLAFDTFYAWGKIILKDYDEIDRYLADAKQIYDSLQNIKEIEHVFGYNDEFREIIARYRTLTEKQEKTKLLTEFLEIWKQVGLIYGPYKEKLLKQEKAYGGMLYRSLAELLTRDHFQHPFTHYHFCGFNALSKSEEVIFDALVKGQRATLYWDIDQHLLNDPKEEAADFMREYQAKWPDAIFFDADSLKISKTIHVHGVPQNMAQGVLASERALEYLNQGAAPEETAIVLADEQMLIPLLYLMPLSEHKLNVTMGYPMRSTVVFDFVISYLELWSKVTEKEGFNVFHVYDLRPFLSNAYTSVFFPEVYQRLNDLFINEHRSRVQLNELKEWLKVEALSALFDIKQDWEGIYEAIKTYLTAVFYHFKEKEEHPADREFIYFFLKSLNQLNGYLGNHPDLSLKLVKKIIQEHFRSIKIPFEGEPVEGIQVMGFLETRTLDFKNVIVVSANEGKLPTARKANSYIPFGLRKVFGLPTFEEQDAIYAYHFKRLLQRAQQIDLIYDHATIGDSKGEESRFILQLKRQLQDLPQVDWQNKSYESHYNAAQLDATITISKTEKVMQLLEKYVDGNAGNKFLSPTSLTNYITCSLKFYLKNVAGFDEQDEVDEDMDARHIGLVVHKVLEKLYQPLNEEVTEADITHFQKLVKKELKEVMMAQRIIQPNQKLTGRDLVTEQIMEQMIQKVLQNDKKDTPFVIRGIETTAYEHHFQIPHAGKVRLGGSIDRMDEKDGVMRIIDYKTGKAEFLEKKNPTDEEFIDKHFEDPKYKSGFQGLVYALLVSNTLNNPLKVGITSMRNLSQGTKWLKDGATLDQTLLSEFESRLEVLVKEIYDPEIPFTQTADEERCKYCEFAGLCQRSNDSAF